MQKKEVPNDSSLHACNIVKLVVFAGPPCSGKSSVAAKFAARQGYVHLQMDQIRVELYPDSDQRKEHREAAYREMHKRAERLLRRGQGVIVDATYQPFNQREDLQRVAERSSVPVYVIECIVTPQEAVHRFRDRSAGHPAVDLTSSRVEELARKFPFSEIGLQLDTTLSILDCVSEVEAYIRLRRPVSFSLWAKPPVGYGSSAPPPTKKASAGEGDSRGAKPTVDKVSAAEKDIRLTEYSRRRARALAIRAGVFLSCAAAFVIIGSVPTFVFVLKKWELSRALISHSFHATLAVNQSFIFMLFLIFPVCGLLRNWVKETLRIVTGYLMNLEVFSMLLVCLTTAWLLRSFGHSTLAKYAFPIFVLVALLYGWSRLTLVPRRGLRPLGISRDSYWVGLVLVIVVVSVAIGLSSGGLRNIWRNAHLFITKPECLIVLWVATLVFVFISYGTRSFARRSDGPVRATRDWPWIVVFAVTSIILSLQVIETNWPGSIQSAIAYIASRQLSVLSDWGLFWLGLAGLSAAIEPVVRVIEPIWSRALAILNTGRVSRYVPCDDTRPSDLELYDVYRNKTTESAPDGFSLFGVPLYFVIEPKEHVRFDILMRRNHPRTSESELVTRSAECGLDWKGFVDWRKSAKAKDYWDWIQEHCIGCTGIDKSELGHGKLSIGIARAPWIDYVSRELSVNLKSRLLPPDMRWIFEGDRWETGEVDLNDLQYAAHFYSMIVSTASLVTTSDNYIVLQRRSKHISEGAGGIAATASGFSHWGKDTALFGRWGKQKSLVGAALRELHEETGILPADLDLAATAPHFMGAAFNLLHGRDLNFYAHFQCKLTSEEVALLRPLARDRWESAQYIFLPVAAVKADGTLKPPHTKILFEATRHLRGSLFCFAKCRWKAEGFKEVVG